MHWIKYTANLLQRKALRLWHIEEDEVNNDDQNTNIDQVVLPSNLINGDRIYKLIEGN